MGCFFASISLVKKKLTLFLISLLSLPLIIFVAQKVQRLLSRAAYQPANIVINSQEVIGPLNKVWQGFVQGGEEPPPMLNNTVSKMRELLPRYIRLDHIYDYYSIVQKKDSGFEYKFERLDETVDDILTMEALPFFSLSYMPPAFTSSGSVIDIPSNWNDWKDLIRATIEHYSGKDGKNLSHVYYEVWNEPELPQFGSWNLSAEKDYRLLYFYAVTGANEAKNVNNFYIGGPSVGSYYPNWVKGLLSYVTQNNLRFDFYSWHRYTKKPQEYSSDAYNTRKILTSFPSHANIPLLLTEWAIESENLPINNSDAAAAFTVSTASPFQNNINLAFAFEVKDGPPPNGGKWGLLTHEKDGQPLSEKPRFKAFKALNNLKENRVSVNGEGTFVNCLASKSDKNITAILSNYDLSGKNSENVPVTFIGLDLPLYNLKYNYPLQETSGSYELKSTNGILSKNFLMPANSVLLLELIPTTKGEERAPLTSEQNNDSSNQTLLLKNSQDSLVFRTPEFYLANIGSINFDIKTLWGKDDRSFIIFEIPFLSEENIVNKLFLAKQKTKRGNFLAFGNRKNEKESEIIFPIDDWEENSWHHVEINWNQTEMSLSVDKKPKIKTEEKLNIKKGTILMFYPIEAAIDNLNIVMDGKEIMQRTFDGGVDR